MTCFCNLQNDLYHTAFSIPVDVQKGRLVYRTASCLQGDSSSFLELTPGSLTATREQRPCCCWGAPISPGAVWWGSEGTWEFLLTAPKQVIKCSSRVAQNSSILVPFWEKQGLCYFGIIQIAENQSVSENYFIYSRWWCKSCHSKRSFLLKSLFYSLPSLLLLTAWNKSCLGFHSHIQNPCRILNKT